MGNIDNQIQRSDAEMGEDQIASLLGSLRRVSAPNDFYFKVKARIELGRPARASFGMPVWLKFAAPLLLLVAMMSYFGVRQLGSGNGSKVVPVAEAQPQVVAPPVTSPAAVPETVEPAQTVAKVTPPRGVTDVKRTEKTGRFVHRSEVTPESGGSSVDEAAKPTTTILRKGLDPDAKLPESPKDFEHNILASEALDLMGVKGVFTAAGWKAASVLPKTAAERMGIKAGDVIETLNDQHLGEKTSFGNRLTVKTVRVIRDGKPVSIGPGH